ncbi:MAG: electron transfer flavoprotein subunit beta/FixA family protein [Actinobacteria bacterium]|nr:electron transfer flavoprotein subunit beta/FixA family protein [Actinomycetota bacterium]MBU1492742.1 electron transfer flavoprotein subunit beta/FixA family protein [Actinomycetota bacterium]
MKILVLLKMVPDVVEELEVAPDGRALDTEFLRLIVNERDDHALEQALLLREDAGGEVVVAGLDAPEVDDVLFSALAKGADRAIKLTGFPEGSGAPAVAGMVAGTLPSIDGLLPVDLILTGCQALDDLDGMIGPLLAAALDLPYLGLVAAATVEDGGMLVSKEYSGGVLGDFRVELPAVLGIQAAAKPPRYVPIAKVRQAMSTGTIEGVAASPAGPAPSIEVIEMTKPESAGHAEMITGSPSEAAARIAAVLTDRGLL